MRDKDANFLFLNNLTDFLGDSNGQDITEVRKELYELGVRNIDNYIKKAKALIAEKQSESKRDWLAPAREAHAAVLKQLNKMTDSIPENLDIRKAVSDLIYANKGAAAFFRNFQGLSDEDLRSLYLDYVKLKKLEDENEKQDS